MHKSLNNGVKAGLIDQAYLNSEAVMQKPAWATRAPNRIKLEDIDHASPSFQKLHQRINKKNEKSVNTD